MERIGHSWVRRVTTAGAAALLLSSVACGSSSTTSVGPSAFEKCSVEASAAPASFPPEGGDGRLTISTEAECAWSAASGASWISLTSGSGQGAATVNFKVAANAEPAARSSSVTVGSREVSVSAGGGGVSISPVSRRREPAVRRRVNGNRGHGEQRAVRMARKVRS